MTLGLNLRAGGAHDPKFTISLENVLTGREKFSATVEICLLKF